MARHILGLYQAVPAPHGWWRRSGTMNHSALDAGAAPAESRCGEEGGSGRVMADRAVT